MYYQGGGMKTWPDGTWVCDYFPTRLLDLLICNYVYMQLYLWIYVFFSLC